jgi:hypothetical protein
MPRIIIVIVIRHVQELSVASPIFTPVFITTATFPQCIKVCNHICLNVVLPCTRKHVHTEEVILLIYFIILL